METINKTWGGLPIRNATKKGYLMAHDGDGIDISTRIETHRGTVQPGMAQTIKAQVDVGVLQMDKEYRIRKLTPKECWRLMGFADEDFERAKQHNSDTSLYKQAGNSIVVQVLENIFKQMIDE